MSLLPKKIPIVIQLILFILGCIVAIAGFAWIAYVVFKVFEYKFQPITQKTDDGRDISF